jgi:hypothetical protein
MLVTILLTISKVNTASLLEEDEEVTFSKEIKSHADNFLVE